MTQRVLTLGGESKNVGFPGAKRGDKVTTLGGSEARFVGRMNGIDWLCYHPDDSCFEAMCLAFESRLAAN